MIILIAIILFLKILTYLIIFDIIISWLMLFGLKSRPKILGEIIDPLYNWVKQYIPTTIGPIDLTPIVLFLLISFITGTLYILFPELKIEIINYGL